MSDAGSHSNFNPLAAAAGRAPPGLSPQDRLSLYNGIPLTAVLGVLASVAAMMWSIRIYAKIGIIPRLGWDDRKLCTATLKRPLRDTGRR